jgi:PP-loop superfamily ATP-utilizing enzyme
MSLNFPHCQTCNKSSSNKVSKQFSSIGVDSVCNGINTVDSWELLCFKNIISLFIRKTMDIVTSYMSLMAMVMQ